MDWMDGLNEALGYIEKNLDGEIHPEEIESRTVCPIGIFQRFFMLAAGMTLTDYIRRRRLSKAAWDLVQTTERIIDIACKYGYDSPDAFSVAFKRLFGATPSLVRKSKKRPKPYDRLHFRLTVTQIKEDEMKRISIDSYRYCEPLFEGARILISHHGASYSPEYIQGISGAAFKIAIGCPSRPTCVCDMWTPDLFRLLGFEIRELPYRDADENDIFQTALPEIKAELDRGNPVLVWNAVTNYEWDVVCGYDEESRQFIGRGSYRNGDEYAREPWERSNAAEGAPVFGALYPVRRVNGLDERAAEVRSLENAVKHAHAPQDLEYPEGMNAYHKWAEKYRTGSGDRAADDAYCHSVYSSVRRAAAAYLREIAYKYQDNVVGCLQKAADCFEKEAQALEEAAPLIDWNSPWGVDAGRSAKLAPLLEKAGACYEIGIRHIEEALLDLQQSDAAR